MKEIKSISFIGSGNLATQLAIELHSKGFQIDSILSRTLDNALLIAEKVKALGTNNFNELSLTSDLYIVSLKDDIIESYLKDLNLPGKIIVHTSGSFETKKLESISSKKGCFYPLQTFSKDVSVDFKNIPIFIESEDSTTIKLLSQLAKKITSNVQVINAKQKKALHISAIGVNNFTHYILSKSKEYCEHNSIEFSNLKELLKQTIDIVENDTNPLDKQTGPARRGDIKTIKDHLNVLSENNNFKSLYQDLSQHILSEFHGEKFKL